MEERHYPSISNLRSPRCRFLFCGWVVLFKGLTSPQASRYARVSQLLCAGRVVVMKMSPVPPKNLLDIREQLGSRPWKSRHDVRGRLDEPGEYSDTLTFGSCLYKPFTTDLGDGASVCWPTASQGIETNPTTWCTDATTSSESAEALALTRDYISKLYPGGR